MATISFYDPRPCAGIGTCDDDLTLFSPKRHEVELRVLGTAVIFIPETVAQKTGLDPHDKIEAIVLHDDDADKAIKTFWEDEDAPQGMALHHVERVGWCLIPALPVRDFGALKSSDIQRAIDNMALCIDKETGERVPRHWPDWEPEKYIAIEDAAPLPAALWRMIEMERSYHRSFTRSVPEMIMEGGFTTNISASIEVLIDPEVDQWRMMAPVFTEFDPRSVHGYSLSVVTRMDPTLDRLVSLYDNGNPRIAAMCGGFAQSRWQVGELDLVQSYFANAFISPREPFARVIARDTALKRILKKAATIPASAFPKSKAKRPKAGTRAVTLTEDCGPEPIVAPQDFTVDASLSMTAEPSHLLLFGLGKDFSPRRFKPEAGFSDEERETTPRRAASNVVEHARHVFNMDHPANVPLDRLMIHVAEDGFRWVLGRVIRVAFRYTGFHSIAYDDGHSQITPEGAVLFPMLYTMTGFVKRGDGMMDKMVSFRGAGLDTLAFAGSVPGLLTALANIQNTAKAEWAEALDWIGNPERSFILYNGKTVYLPKGHAILGFGFGQRFVEELDTRFPDDVSYVSPEDHWTGPELRGYDAKFYPCRYDGVFGIHLSRRRANQYSRWGDDRPLPTPRFWDVARNLTEWFGPSLVDTDTAVDPVGDATEVVQNTRNVIFDIDHEDAEGSEVVNLTVAQPKKRALDL